MLDEATWRQELERARADGNTLKTKFTDEQNLFLVLAKWPPKKISWRRIEEIWASTWGHCPHNNTLRRQYRDLVASGEAERIWKEEQQK